VPVKHCCLLTEILFNPLRFVAAQSMYDLVYERSAISAWKLPSMRETIRDFSRSLERRSTPHTVSTNTTAPNGADVKSYGEKPDVA